MKRVQPDIKDATLNTFIGNAASSRKIKRLWGTTTVGGVEVFKLRQYYWPPTSRSDNFEKLFKYLGAYEDATTSNKKGLKAAWVYFNKNAETVLNVNYRDFVAGNLNQLWWDDADGPQPNNLTLTTSIVIEGLIKQPADRTGRIYTTDLLDPRAPTSELITLIQENYEELWNTCIISQEGVGVINKGVLPDSPRNTNVPDEDDLSPDDPWLKSLSRHALRDNGLSCSIKDVEIGYGTAGSSYATYVVTIEIPYQGFTSTSGIVQDIVDDITGTYAKANVRAKFYRTNEYYTKSDITTMDSSDLEDDATLITRPYLLWEDASEEVESKFSSLWVKSGGSWYLKAGPFRNPSAYGFTFKELVPYISALPEIGYKKKKASVWKKVVAFVIFIIAVVVTFLTDGAAAPWAKAALAVLVGALTLSLITLALAATGHESSAAAFAEVSKTIEPLVIIATVVLVVTGTANAFSKARDAANAAANAAATAAAGSAATATVIDIAVEFIKSIIDDLIQSFIQGAADFAAGAITKASLAFSNTMIKLLMMPQKNKLANLGDKNRDLLAEYDQLMEELNQEYDVLQGFMHIYAKPATADWSMYASTFDLPYERGGGPLALGNVQRTTKQAIRRGDYSDSAFDNILII